MANIYRIWQDVNNGYDTYDSAIVCADSEEEARWMHPAGLEWDGSYKKYDTWSAVENVQVELIGTAKDGFEKGVILASFNAG